MNIKVKPGQLHSGETTAAKINRFDFDKKELLQIPELSGLSSDSKLAQNIEESCAGFVNKFPGIEEEIQNAVASGDRNTLFRELNSLCEMLRKIGANDFVFKRFETFFNSFLADAACLSLDIQLTSRSLREISSPEKVMQQIMSGNSSTDLLAPSILALDSTSLYLSRLKNMLSGTRYKLICVNTVNEALNHIEREPPDLILADALLHGMNAFELPVKIKETGCRAPVILLTGTTTKEIVAKAFQSGFADIIIKSADDSHTLKRINNFFIADRSI